MPTTRPRHTITETPPVQAALDELRACMQDSERIDFAELVRLGAEVKARRLMAEDWSRQAALHRLADMVRAKSFPFKVDVAAADEVKHLGLIAKYE
ncbi:MAG TPA: hypothetical protein VGY30_09135 [Solirubrobacteraceae bacterium]|nr:hypothetical protein [Solirubrobacteraceae bacterium]